MGNQYYKKKALSTLEGKWKRELGLMTLYLVIAMVMNFVVTYKLTNEGISETTLTYQVVSQLAAILVTVISFGYIRHVMREVYEGDIRYGSGGIFYYYTTKEVIYLLGLNLVVGVFVLLWSLLFIIPGVVMSLAYTQSIYIKIENKDKPILETIKESKELMYGHKWEYFVLNLSFIGWILLGIVTVVGIIPVSVYIQYTMIEYYKELRTKQGVHKETTNSMGETVNLSK